MAKGKTIPPDIQWIVVRLSSIMDTLSIAAYVDIGERSVRRILAHFNEHEMVRDPKSRDPHLALERSSRHRLRELDIEYLFTSVKDIPDVYLEELKLQLEHDTGCQVSLATIWRALRKGGLTMKKLSPVAIEQSEAKRRHYLNRVAFYEPDQLIFVDESSVDRRTTYRGRAWSIRGTKAQRKAFFVRGKRYSVLPALSRSDAILHCEIVQGSFNSDLFKIFIERLLTKMQPYPGPNSVIVMDNCRIHKHPDILAAIEERGARYEFLPPYSPDYNPIELAFSAMKYHLRRDGQYVRMALTRRLSDEDVHTTLLRALLEISPQDAHGWYRHCGYF